MLRKLRADTTKSITHVTKNFMGVYTSFRNY